MRILEPLIGKRIPTIRFTPRDRHTGGRVVKGAALPERDGGSGCLIFEKGFAD